MMVTTCLVCDAAILQSTEGHLCRACRYQRARKSISIHWVKLRNAVEDGTRSDFYNAWGTKEAQTTELATRPPHWVLVVGDILRMHGHWLDDWDNFAA